MVVPARIILNFCTYSFSDRPFTTCLPRMSFSIIAHERSGIAFIVVKKTSMSDAPHAFLARSVISWKKCNNRKCKRQNDWNKTYFMDDI